MKCYFSAAFLGCCCAALLLFFPGATRAEAAYRLRWTFQAERSVNSIVLSPQGNILAVGTDVDLGIDGKNSGAAGLYLLSPKTGQVAYHFATQGDVRGVAFTPDGRFLLDINGRGESFGQLNVWDVKTKKLRARFENPLDEDFTIMALSSDGRTAACATYSHVYLVDTLSGKLKGQLPAVDDYSFYSLAFSPNGKYLLGLSWGSDHSNLRLWDIRSGVLMHPKVASGKGFGQAIYLKNGHICLTGRDGIQLWDENFASILYKVKYPLNNSNVISIDALGALTAIGLEHHPYSLPDGSTISSYPVLIWNLRTQKIVDQLEGYLNDVNTVAFLPDSSLVSGGRDHTVKLWEEKKN